MGRCKDKYIHKPEVFEVLQTLQHNEAWKKRGTFLIIEAHTNYISIKIDQRATNTSLQVFDSLFISSRYHSIKDRQNKVKKFIKFYHQCQEKFRAFSEEAKHLMLIW